MKILFVNRQYALIILVQTRPPNLNGHIYFGHTNFASILQIVNKAAIFISHALFHAFVYIYVQMLRKISTIFTWVRISRAVGLYLIPFRTGILLVIFYIWKGNSWKLSSYYLRHHFIKNYTHSGLYLLRKTWFRFPSNYFKLNLAQISRKRTKSRALKISSASKMFVF